jgi:hypothetical protein
MYQLVVELAATERAAADADGECRAPSVFMNQADGYERWRKLAADTGRAAQWAEWSEDESCAQRDAAVDRETAHAWTEYCEWQGGGSRAHACSDAHEPNDRQADATALTGEEQGDLAICRGDSDWFAVAGGGVVRIEFSHANGDLDMAAFDASGAQMAVSEGTSDSETVTVPTGGAVRVYGYEGAANTYRIVLP